VFDGCLSIGAKIAVQLSDYESYFELPMTQFGMLSYAVLGGLYAILCLLLLTSWRGRKLGGYLILACLVSVVWAASLAVEPSRLPQSDLFLFCAEVLRSGSWLMFLSIIASKIGVSRMTVYLANAIWVGVLLYGVGLWVGRDLFGPIINLANVLIPGGLAMALAGLMLIEQLYRNTPSETRWGIKAIVLGLGGLFAYDLFLYSQGVLFGALDATTWQARGAVNSLFIPLIAISARRNPDWDLNIFVSRQVVFHSMTLLVVGGYLLLMSLGGYAIILYGGSWGGLLRTIFFVGAGLVLVLLLFSSVLRSKARVFLAKHFYRNKYDYREEWLRLISTLGAFEGSSTRQIVIKALAQIVGSTGGLLWELNEREKTYHLVATYHLSDEFPDLAVESSLISFMEDKGWLIDLREYKADPGFYGNLQPPDWLENHPEAWLFVPLVARQKLIGVIMLNKAPGLGALDYEDRDLLKTAGNHIAVHLAQEQSDNLLAEAQQFETYNRLTAFLMHDLNNLIAQQSLIVKNAEKHKRNPAFVDDAIETIRGSVERMKRVMHQLKRGENARVNRPTELRFIVSSAVDNCMDREPVPELNLNGVDVSLSVDQEQFIMVLTHLIRNAQDATPSEGNISVDVRQEDGKVEIDITDTGEGMAPEFIRDRLFRPFDSTKGVQGMGIGAYQAREFARKYGGELRVQSAVSQGTTVIVSLPLVG
jgi:putative PEP-CTERM system histidine kinase